ncbi:bifunctional N-acetylglucosamine-1-phosphate uridyltransferase/glucosamine-1-phosphate acetyltransferase [candidate division WOR-3 bacterium]|nr:bifunctional N-acetylglucosamine-1-phosphate uridyltransferase/glucosamine-1-phosphate acetyltransferase [candidate division WOR-3 bacterium]
MNGLGVVILAAGEGKRMKSETPKALLEVAGYPMLCYVLDQADRLHPDKTVVVIGKGGDLIMEFFKSRPLEFVEQKPQLGTGHAVLQTEKMFSGSMRILVLYGDVPLVKAKTLEDFILRSEKATASILGMKLDKPGSYGRLITEGENLSAIREARDANDSEKLIKLVNTGIMICERKMLFESLAEVKPENDQKEYYLTDTIRILNKKRVRVMYSIASDSSEFQGANDRAELSILSSLVRNDKMNELMKKGVTITSPENTVIDYEVDIGAGSVIHPFAYLTGKTKIGENCVVGPHCHLKDFVLKNGETA